MTATLESYKLPQQALHELIADPNVSLASVLAEVGFEGLSGEARLSLIEKATLDDYMTVIDVIHQKVAPEHSTEIHPEAVKIVNPKTDEVRHLTADPVRRVDIMDHALSAAKQVVRKYREEGGSLNDTLQRCGNLGAFGIVLSHNYENGNGRAARAAGELIHNGYDGANPDLVANLQAVSANRPDKGFRISSYVPTGDWSERANQDPAAFLDMVAALDQPLNELDYADAVRGSFTTPRMQ